MFLYLFCCFSYYLTYSLLSSHPLQNVLYPDTSSIVTKEYRIVNTVKAVTLGVISPACTFILYHALSPYHEPNLHLMYFFGATYASLDMSALIYNPNCHTSTLVHHILVQFLYYYCYYHHYNMDTLVKGITVYAIFSCYAYLVNYRLAIRFMKHKHENLINNLSLAIYFMCCGFNWSIQLYLILFEMKQTYLIEKLVYTGLIGMIMNDDIFLIKFLLNSYPNREVPNSNNNEKIRTKSLA